MRAGSGSVRGPRPIESSIIWGARTHHTHAPYARYVGSLGVRNDVRQFYWWMDFRANYTVILPPRHAFLTNHYFIGCYGLFVPGPTHVPGRPWPGNSRSSCTQASKRYRSIRRCASHARVWHASPSPPDYYALLYCNATDVSGSGSRYPPPHCGTLQSHAPRATRSLRIVIGHVGTHQPAAPGMAPWATFPKLLAWDPSTDVSCAWGIVPC